MNKKRYFEQLSKERHPVGKLSPELRKALNLQDDMLPFWIYRMRILGYPPAWMEAAEMSTTLNLIDNSSTVEELGKNPFTPNNDGEIDDTLQYNKDSLIEFPGFNSPVPENVKDDWLILGMPPLIMKQQLSEAVKSMKLLEPVPYKKAKLDTSTTKEDTPKSPDRTTPSKDSPSNSLQEKSSLIPNDEDSNDTIVDDNDDSGINNDQKQKLSESVTANVSLNNTTIEYSPQQKQDQNRKMNMVSLGTPVPKSIKPGLPSLDKWAEGMGELLYFENLPTSTGAYKDKMKGILSRVRDRFHKE